MHDLRLFHSYCRFLNLTGAPQWLGACLTPLFYSSLSLVIYLQVETFPGADPGFVERGGAAATASAAGSKGGPRIGAPPGKCSGY